MLCLICVLAPSHWTTIINFSHSNEVAAYLTDLNVLLPNGSICSDSGTMVLIYQKCSAILTFTFYKHIYQSTSSILLMPYSFQLFSRYRYHLSFWHSSWTGCSSIKQAAPLSQSLQGHDAAGKKTLSMVETCRQETPRREEALTLYMLNMDTNNYWTGMWLGTEELPPFLCFNVFLTFRTGWFFFQYLFPFQKRRNFHQRLILG